MISSSLKQAIGLQNKLENELDQLDVTDKHYNRKYESLNCRLEKVFETLEESERNLSDCEARLQSIRQQCLSMDSIYESLKIFDKLYEKMVIRYH